MRKRRVYLTRGFWTALVKDMVTSFNEKHFTVLAASIAYGGTLAFFPLVIAAVAIASSIMSTEQIESVVSDMSQFLPSDIATLISTQLRSAFQDHSSNFIAASVGILIALIGASGATNSLVSALNAIYVCKETRNFAEVRMVSFGLTALFVVGIVVMLPLIFLGSGMLRDMGFDELMISMFDIFRWLLLALAMSIGLSTIYRFAPNRPSARWYFLSWGSVAATVLWLLVTALFFIYVQDFANFSDSYSLFAGIIVLMIWLNYSAMTILIGAEVNHQLSSRRIQVRIL